MATRKTGKVKHYRISKRFAREIRQAILCGRRGPSHYGDNLEAADREFFLMNISIGIGSESENRYYGYRRAAYFAAYRRVLATLSPEQVRTYAERYRTSLLSPEVRELRRLRAEVGALRADLNARDTPVAV